VAVTGGHGVANVVVLARVLSHEVLNELDVRVARSLHTRSFISLFLCTRSITGTCYAAHLSTCRKRQGPFLAEKAVTSARATRKNEEFQNGGWVESKGQRNSSHCGSLSSAGAMKIVLGGQALAWGADTVPSLPHPSPPRPSLPFPPLPFPTFLSPSLPFSSLPLPLEVGP